MTKMKILNINYQQTWHKLKVNNSYKNDSACLGPKWLVIYLTMSAVVLYYWFGNILYYILYVYRVHYTQNDRLEITISTQKSVWKNMLRIPRYWSKCVKIWGFGLADQIPTHLYQYLRIRCIFFKTDCCVETVSSSRSFWIPWTL